MTTLKKKIKTTKLTYPNFDRPSLEAELSFLIFATFTEPEAEEKMFYNAGPSCTVLTGRFGRKIFR